MVRRFEYAGRLPSLNETIDKNRANKYAGAGQKKGVQNALFYSIKQAVGKGTISPITKPCVVLITFIEPNKKRDVDNVQSSTKFIMDALQQAEIIPNDNYRWVKDIKHEIKYSDTARVVVELFEDTEFKIVLKKVL